MYLFALVKSYRGVGSPSLPLISQEALGSCETQEKQTDKRGGKPQSACLKLGPVYKLGLDKVLDLYLFSRVSYLGIIRAGQGLKSLLDEKVGDLLLTQI